MQDVAIVGMACRYPDARSPEELWENVLAQRRAFRTIPSERLNTEDYFHPERQTADRTYSVQAAVIEGYEFDRVRFRVTGDCYRAADLAHWLALDQAGQALESAGFPDGAGLPRESTGVILGNTLTGEFSRANAMRLRWPYVRRVLDSVLRERGVSAEECREVLRRAEEEYKAPFPAVDGETLAGALSNTIAGRICNHFRLKGGGYTVDGACASSLLAMIQGCRAISSGDLSVALVGGVDLSMDPFELVGFAKAGALAGDEMRVFDARSGGFWPGEGCGFVVLMRRSDAVAQKRPIHAVLRGWGMSSDGSGGITRPEVEGQLLALRRAYELAGFGAETVAYFEAHGTGTAVGDVTEARTILQARNCGEIAVLGSVKANIGHTKAAAGVAGVIKAVMALRSQVLPPATGNETPHPEVEGRLSLPRQGALWPVDRPLRAAVSAMGFGGFNTHVTLESEAPRRCQLTTAEERLIHTAQDAEGFFFGAGSREALEAKIDRVRQMAPKLSRSELTDLAATLAREARGEWRAAAVASSPSELERGLTAVSIRHVAREPRIGFLFPGQGTQPEPDGGAWGRRFPSIRRFYRGLPAGDATTSTRIAQPHVIANSLAALTILEGLGLEATIAMGHSVGELTALHWAGAVDECGLREIAVARGRVMEQHAEAGGRMASIRMSARDVHPLLRGRVSVAALNSWRQTVVSGEAGAVEEVVLAAAKRGSPSVYLSVGGAFHSELMRPAEEPLRKHLKEHEWRPLARSVYSTVTGELLDTRDLTELLCQQLTAPVRFAKAFESARGLVDLWIEVGPGRVLSSLAADTDSTTTIVSCETGSNSLRPLLSCLTTAFSMGARVDCARLFEDRFTRAFSLDWKPRFFESPCEAARRLEIRAPGAEDAPPPQAVLVEGNSSILQSLRSLVARRCELPEKAIRDDSRFLSDLHLNSITVGEIAVDAAREFGISPPSAPAEYADATVAELAQALSQARATTPREEQRLPAGIDSWVRVFAVELKPVPRQLPQSAGTRVLRLPDDPWGQIPYLLDAGRMPPDSHLAIARRTGAAAFARCLALERPDMKICVVSAPATEIEEAEAAAPTRYTEAHYAENGVRHEPRLVLLEEAEPVNLPLGPDDVLLVTGGGKGIAAECALALARESGARLVLLGRSSPDQDAELAANLARISAAGVCVRYVVADVTQASDVVEAAREATAILHAAGSNVPQLAAALDESAFRAALDPKVRGLDHLLAAAEPARLKLLVTFGSVIARTGLRGEAHYAAANDWLVRRTEDWQAAHPECRCLAIEWSVWAGAGMGQKLGVLEGLMRQGVSPIPLDVGVQVLLRLLQRRFSRTSVVVTGRFPQLPTLRMESTELPLLRFLERPRVFYPGIEIVADAEISSGTDPYIEDHTLRGTRLLPAVMGLEAMAQAAMSVTGRTDPPSFANLRMVRPITVPEAGTTVLRVAALAREDGRVDVVLRVDESGFQFNHFEASCVWGEKLADETRERVEGRLGFDVVRDVYEKLLFHRGRFRRVSGYRQLRSTSSVAEISPDPRGMWFGSYLPQTLTLGDPGARDAALHSLQPSIPHARILPCGAERLTISAAALNYSGIRLAHARERSRMDKTLFFDVAVTDEGGQLVEEWRGLELRIVEPLVDATRDALPAPLLAAYLERRVSDLTNCPVAVCLGSGSTAELARQLGTLVVGYRPDGKPQCTNGTVSGSHSHQCTLAVSSSAAAACDMQQVEYRTAGMWRDLLGTDRLRLAELVSGERSEDVSTAATRVWTAIECVRKAGLALDASVVYYPSGASDSVQFAVRGFLIATFVVRMNEAPGSLAFAIMTGGK